MGMDKYSSTFSVRIKNSLIQKLEDEASRTGAAKNSIIVRALEAALENKAPERDPVVLLEMALELLKKDRN